MCVVLQLSVQYISQRVSSFALSIASVEPLQYSSSAGCNLHGEKLVLLCLFQQEILSDSSCRPKNQVILGWQLCCFLVVNHSFALNSVCDPVYITLSGTVLVGLVNPDKKRTVTS